MSLFWIVIFSLLKSRYVHFLSILVFSNKYSIFIFYNIVAKWFARRYVSSTDIFFIRLPPFFIKMGFPGTFLIFSSVYLSLLHTQNTQCVSEQKLVGPHFSLSLYSDPELAVPWNTPSQSTLPIRCSLFLWPQKPQIHRFLKICELYFHPNVSDKTLTHIPDWDLIQQNSQVFTGRKTRGVMKKGCMATLCEHIQYIFN